jgi:hypothetical protein
LVASQFSFPTDSPLPIYLPIDDGPDSYEQILENARAQARLIRGIAVEIMESIRHNEKFDGTDPWTLSLAKLLGRELFNRFATSFDTTATEILLACEGEISDIFRARQIAEARQAQTAPARRALAEKLRQIQQNAHCHPGGSGSSETEASDDPLGPIVDDAMAPAEFSRRMDPAAHRLSEEKLFRLLQIPWEHKCPVLPNFALLVANISPHSIAILQHRLCLLFLSARGNRIRRPDVSDSDDVSSYYRISLASTPQEMPGSRAHFTFQLPDGVTHGRGPLLGSEWMIGPGPFLVLGTEKTGDPRTLER